MKINEYSLNQQFIQMKNMINLYLESNNPSILIEIYQMMDGMRLMNKLDKELNEVNNG